MSTANRTLKLDSQPHSTMSGMEDLDPSEEITQEWLDKQLKTSKEQLQQRVKKLEAVHVPGRDDGEEEKSDNPLGRLAEMKDQLEALELTKEVTEWSDSCDYHGANVFQEAQECVQLAEILLKHESQTSLHKGLFEREYQPLHTYVRSNLILELRRTLLQAGYPSAEGCGKLMDQAHNSSSPLAKACDWLTRLQATHHQLVNHTQSRRFSSPWSAGETCDVLVEFFRPLVERVRFHFVERSEDRVTSTKIDRLPEWLLRYLQEHVLEGKPSNPKNTASCSSPWELVTLGLGSYCTEEMPILFLNELVGLVRFVLGSERNFFRHPNISGPESNPMLLCNAIEQLLEFDGAMRNLLPQGQGERLVRLMDVFVSGDEELLSWWLAREKEMIFATLFDNHASSEEPPSALVKTRISPRAELFCALMRSVQIKASVFSFSGPYLNAVAVPLCMQFLDAVHESATDLRQALAGPVSSHKANFLTHNLEDWMAVINGCRLAAAILTRENPWAHKAGMSSANNSSVNDLARFGRSLEQLQNVFIEEFATTFVETYLMERMRLARYLMRCSHFLSHKSEEGEDEDEDYDPDLSFDLKESLNSFRKFLELCGDGDQDDIDENDAEHFATAFAPRVMKAKVMPLFLDKFLEVALDLHGLVPTILPEGAAVFGRDMDALFGGLELAEGEPACAKLSRLRDITKLMTMEAMPLQALQSALLCLVGGPEDPERPRWIQVHQFTADATLFEQAECMLKAKGFSLSLEDALSILNRRQDLARGAQF